MSNFIQESRIFKVIQSVVVLALGVVFFSPNLVFSAPISEKNKKCDQIFDQAKSDNHSNVYLQVLKCELEDNNDTFAAAGDTTLGTVANLDQPNITGGDITLNPPSTCSP